ncbi:calcium/sodium antiporter [Halocynthiibacter sp. C4]|uniref:calcium/sodium antiporter n=1 Tax=Halocynthiibacter sp. C4 TaxID=2992758 RepID=UPI00237A6E66|nr:calcium/sodium antiporter [Halocynthiibacter sp. C4]MDE0590848.1 calcium/sodium antiporter [Halocynthiibacter sp. C4]
MIDWLLVGLGLIILLLAGDLLVRGAVNLSLRLGIPALIVSLTIVAFGTSAPELLITIEAVSDDLSGMALGNVIGSNTANILLVLGVPALLATMHTSECNTRKNYLYMIGATLLFMVVCFLGPITWIHSLVLLGTLALILFEAGREAVNHHKDGKQCIDDDLENPEGADPHMPSWRIGVFLVAGLIGLPFGADLLVEHSVNIADRFGISETVIGLTLVAIGTSLPELATTVMAALRRQADVALGNVIGSNMFNLLAIMGVGGLIGPIVIEPEVLKFDIWVMLGASLLLAPFVFLRWNITRAWGILLTAAYGGYLYAVVQ